MGTNWLNSLALLLIGCGIQSSPAQDRPPTPLATSTPDFVVVPQLGQFPTPAVTKKNWANETFSKLGETLREEPRGPTDDFGLAPQVSAEVKIQNHTATTRLQFQCVNPRQESVSAPVAVPLPQTGPIAFSQAKLTEGKNTVLFGQTELVPTEKAVGEWQKWAKQFTNPALIEFCGFPLLKTPPVHLSPGESQPVTVEYAQTLAAQSSRYDYVLPRSESVQNTIPWGVNCEIQTDQPISTVYCPTHKVRSKRQSANSFQVELDDQEAAQPGSFWLSYLLDQGSELSATLFTQPDEDTPAADGTFLFLVGLPANPPDGQAIPRELTLALDRSGSMQGPKMDQVQAAATQVIEGLNEGESFNIITYNNQVTSFAEKPIKKTAETLKSALEFIQEVQPRGGTNLNGALLESVKQKPTAQTLPIVLFLTDGLPTVGETEEVKIRDVVTKQNSYHRRIFTVGVGVDVNTPLLETIATESRAQPTFVLPSENVKTKVAQLFQSLERPILANAELAILNAQGQPIPDRIRDVYPNPLPDLFKDDHLVVLGRYEGTEPLKFRLKGNYLGTEKTFEFVFPLKDQPSSPFVSRLWASKKIAALVQEIRKSGANADPYVILTNPKQDPQLKSQAEEVLQLTRRYGIFTEYTAFLAQDEHPWMSRREQLDQAYRNFDERAVKTRVGLSSVNQSINNTVLQRQHWLNGSNYFYDANMKRVAVPNVQQLGKGTFFRRGTTWVDARLVDRPHLTPDKIIPFGSREYETLVNQLVTKGEHTPLSLSGNVLIEINNQPILIQAPENNPFAETPTAQEAMKVPKK